MEISLEMLPDFAERFIREVERMEASGAVVVGLRGDLGAGKTTFVQHLARALGVTKNPTSPTFVIAQVYPLSGKRFKRLVHIDAYRLSPDEKDTVGWAEYVKDSNNLIVVEWPERLPWFPEGAPVLRFEVAGGNTRAIAYAP